MSDHAHFSSLMLGLFHSCGAHNIGPDESQRADSEPVVCLQLAEHTANWESAEKLNTSNRIGGLTISTITCRYCNKKGHLEKEL